MQVADINDLKRKIEAIGDLPTFPEVASKVVELVNDSSASMKDIKEEISRDPALAAKVLKFVNSAFYGMPRQVSSLQLALVILGIREIRNIVIGLSVFKAFDGIASSGQFDKKKFWQHSVSCAQIARSLSAKLSFAMEGEDFTAGLLHDIGKIAFDQYFPEEFGAAWKKSIDEKIPLRTAEEETIGVNHAQVGAWMAKNWNLPDQLGETIRFHHSPENAEKHKTLVAIISLANIFSKSEGMKFGGVFMESQLENTVPWQILIEERKALNEIDLARFTFELESEVIQALEFLSVVRPAKPAIEA